MIRRSSRRDWLWALAFFGVGFGLVSAGLGLSQHLAAADSLALCRELRWDALPAVLGGGGVLSFLLGSGLAAAVAAPARRRERVARLPRRTELRGVAAPPRELALN